MKKIISLLLALVMVASLMTTTAFAQGNTLKVQDRTRTYSFQVGDTFTYTYWLHLTSDTIKKVTKASSTGISTSKIKTDVDVQLKSFSGNIMYDDEMLELIDAKTPNFAQGKCVQKTDGLSGSLLDGTVFDFTNGDLFFYVPSTLMTSAEKKTFQKTAVAVTCTFRVKAASSEPTYMRTKLRSLDVYAQYSTVNTEMSIVKNGTANCVYASYETINNEKPTSMLYPLVQDSGMDIRYYDIQRNELRPGAGVTVTFDGYTIDLKRISKTAKTDGSDVVWFYDIPYGTYYVHCSFTDSNNYYYATSDPEKGEVVNIPATGRVQALWLTKPGSSTMSAPVVTSLANCATGVTMKWTAVANAPQYAVFYKPSGGSWTSAGITTGTSYTVTSLTSGTTYAFTARCVNGDGKSYLSGFQSKSITYIAQPAISSIANSATGVTLKWSAVKGAYRYAVFYKTAGSGWTRAGDTTAGSYTVTGLTSGTSYTFTLRCLSKDGKSYISSFDSVGKSITYLSQPVLTGASNSTYGVTVKWNPVVGAAQYGVFYKPAGGGWTLADCTTSSSYTVTGLKSGTTYTFTVRCMNADGTAYTSSFDSTGKTVRYLDVPVLQSADAGSSGITVTWDAVSGADSYAVYRKPEDGAWSRIATVSTLTYTDRGAQVGTPYVYTVRALSGSTSSYFDIIGVSAQR